MALVVLNKNDRKAFTQDVDAYMQLISNGYCLVLCEADDDKEVAMRFFNRGKEEGEPSALGKRKYDLVILGGHGSPVSINFGKEAPGTGPDKDFIDLKDDKLDRLYLDLGDYGQDNRFKPRSWNKMLKRKSAILLSSCFTGGDAETFESMIDRLNTIQIKAKNPGGFQNIMGMISVLATKAAVFAPDMPADTFALEFDAKRRVVGVEFFGAYSPSNVLLKHRGGHAPETRKNEDDQE